MKNEINENEPLLVASVTSSAFLMDCIQGMKRYPDKYFDLAVCDPPYGIGMDNSNKRTKPSRKTLFQYFINYTH